MCPSIGVQAYNVEVRRFVYQPAILYPQSQMITQQWTIDAASVEERAPGLLRRADKSTSLIVGWIKDQNAAATEQEWAQEKEKGGQLHDSCPGYLMDVGLHSRGSKPGVDLRIPRVAVISLGGNPAIHIVAVSHEDSTGFGDLVANAVPLTVLGKESGALHADF